ncbi:MAG: RNA 2',3'-cyclic phosphodiesterase [Sphaerochaetaceae bacterium]|jgi:2'-5' RNA ligase|nr:RNA 2',3'-cyclic phosphodiesterase [Sphaerochaetaceae bacterium]HHU88008.1 RNA 2',3'-cyclic phosphodiesterase [Spirochaetales bacterium]
MRLFIAINFPPGALSYLQDQQRRLEEVALEGRFVAPDKLHLTLAFLGEVSMADSAHLSTLLREVEGEPFELKLQGLGSFRRGRSALWWVGIEDSPPLLEYRERLCNRLLDEGYDFDQRPFRPHVTIARQVVVDEDNTPISPSKGYITGVNRISLMESDYRTYREVYAKELIK